MSRDRDRDRDKALPFSLALKHKIFDSLFNASKINTYHESTSLQASCQQKGKQFSALLLVYLFEYTILFILSIKINFMNTWYFLALDHYLSNLKLSHSAKYLYIKLLVIYPPFIKTHIVKSTLSKHFNLTLRQVDHYLNIFLKKNLLIKSYKTINHEDRKVGHSLYIELTPPNNVLQNYISRYGTDEMMESNNQSIGIQITEALHG